MAASLLSINDGNKTCRVSVSGAEAASLDALPGSGNPGALGRWAEPQGNGEYFVPQEVARNLLGLKASLAPADGQPAGWRAPNS